MVKVSVIMPLYNAEKYMSEAIEGILHQTYKDFELLCIDDCSTDHTKEILSAFAGKEERIRILTNKKRLGAGPSRNRGLKAAKGKYVIFLDGDDVFHERLLEVTCGVMERYGTEVVLFDAVKHVSSDEIHIERTKKYSPEFVREYCKETFCIRDFPAGRFPIWADSIGDKMFLKKFITDNRLEFQDLPSSNDVYFVRMALYCADKIIWAQSEKVLLYTRDHSEPSRISNHRDPMCAYEAWEKLAGDLDGKDMLGDLQNYFYSTFAPILLNLLRQEENEEVRKKFYLFLQSEGIGKCMKYQGVNPEKIDDYAMYILDGIRENAYESGWLAEAETCFRFYMKKNGEKICRFIEEQLQQNKKIILWGAGANGIALIEYLTDRSIRISGIIDRSEKKQGTFICGYEISGPECLNQKPDYILAASQEIYWYVDEMMKNTRTKVVDLMDLLTEEREHWT